MMDGQNQTASFYLSRDKAKGYLKNLLKATLGKLERKSEGAGQQQTELVRDFFRAHRDAPDDVDLADHSTGHLDQMISHLIEKDAHDYQTVVDVGCGNGAMRTKVRSPKYVGIDLHISTEGDDNTTFIQSSVSEAKISHLKLGLTSFYMINCLCYCERVDDLGDFVSANMSSGDVLNIIEPINAFWWETDFDGIRVHVRSPTQIKHRLSAEGLILDESIFCYMDRLLPFAPFRVFQAHRFKKQ